MLANAWEGSWMPPGEHDVVITSYKPFTANSGNRGIEYTFRDNLGRTIKDACYLSQKALWKLANLAKACGMKKQQAASFDETNERQHSWFINKRLRIIVEKGAPNAAGKSYSEVSEYILRENEQELPPDAPNPAADARSNDEPPLASYDEKEIPF